MLPFIRNSPVAVLKAINEYCCNGGHLDLIASALGVDYERFSEIMEWYLCNMKEPFCDPESNPQELLNLILLQLLKSAGGEIKTLEERVFVLEKNLNVLNKRYGG